MSAAGPKPPPREATLYERLGGEAGVRKMLIAFYSRILADKDLEPFFRKTPMEKLVLMQQEFFGAAMDGPHSFSGSDLARVHAGRGIGIRHFSLFTQHMVTTLREIGVQEGDIREVIGRISPLRRDVTGR